MFRCSCRLLLAGVVGITASSSSAQAQVVRALTVTATVPDIGAVVSVSSLQWSEGEADESSASGTVSTKHNGPYLLQVRLTTASPDTVLARQPDGTYQALDPGAWTTVGSGPGGANVSNSVAYRVKSAASSGSPKSIPVVYRVVAP
jgi:hypothetical protein